MSEFDVDYYLEFGHHNQDIGTVVRHLDLFRSKRSVCVIPCGWGQIVEWFRSEGIMCVGYDVSSFLVGKARSNVLWSDIREPPQSGGHDLVVCLDLLEHLDEEGIDKSLDNLSKMLSDDGDLLLRVGTDLLPEFDDDPTHETKRSSRWWLGKAASHGLHMSKGPTEVGEFLLRKSGRVNADDVSVYTSAKRSKIVPDKSWVEIYDGLVISDSHQRSISFHIRPDGLFNIGTGDGYVVSLLPMSRGDRMVFRDGEAIVFSIEGEMIARFPAKTPQYLSQMNWVYTDE